MQSTNIPDPYPCANLKQVGSLPMDKNVLYRSLSLKLKDTIQRAFNVRTEQDFFNKMELNGSGRNPAMYDKFNTGPIILAFITINNSFHLRDKPRRIRPTPSMMYHPTYNDEPDVTMNDFKQKNRLNFYRKYIIQPHKVLMDYFDNKRITILQVNDEPTTEIFVIQLPHTHLISELFTNKNNAHTRAVTQIFEDERTPTTEYNIKKRSLYGVKSTGSVPQNIVHSRMKDMKTATSELQEQKRLINKYQTKQFKSKFSKVGPLHHLSIIMMPSSDANIKLGDGSQGIYDTQVLKQIMINALNEQIHSRMKIQCSSEFIGRMYFLETINGERSQKPHVDSRFNPTTNRDKNCTESSWSADIPITPLGMELNIWPQDASPTNVCKAVRLKIELGQFIMRSPLVVHGGSYPGMRVHMAIATNRNQKPDIDNPASQIVTMDNNRIDYTTYCLPREVEGW